MGGAAIFDLDLLEVDLRDLEFRPSGTWRAERRTERAQGEGSCKTSN
jgi:hypothetical protein